MRSARTRKATSSSNERREHGADAPSARSGRATSTPPGVPRGARTRHGLPRRRRHRGRPGLPQGAQQPRPHDARARDVQLPPRAPPAPAWTPRPCRQQPDAHGAGRVARQPGAVPDAPRRRAHHRGVEAPGRARPRPRGQGRLRRLPLPFGHKASLVKLTERKISPGRPARRLPVPADVHRRPRAREEVPRHETPSTDRRRHTARPGHAARDRADPHRGDAPTSTTRIAPRHADDGGLLFDPYVAGSPFLFKMVAVDLEGNIVEFRRRSSFMERDHNDADRRHRRPPAANRPTPTSGDHASSTSRRPARGLRRERKPDDTTLPPTPHVRRRHAAPSLGDPGRPPLRARAPRRRGGRAGHERAGRAGARQSRLGYPAAVRQAGFAATRRGVPARLDTAGECELRRPGRPLGRVRHAQPERDRPLAALTGPDRRRPRRRPSARRAADFDVCEFFDGVKAKLFGVVPLTDLLKPVGFDPTKVPTFVGPDPRRRHHARRERPSGCRNAPGRSAARWAAAATALKTAVDAFWPTSALLDGRPGQPARPGRRPHGHRR